MRNGAAEACIFRVCNYSLRYNFLNFYSLLAVVCVAVWVLQFAVYVLLFAVCCLSLAVCGFAICCYCLCDCFCVCVIVLY